MPRGTPRHMPAQKALAPRNAPPPHAGAKGPCPAKLPCPAACRRKRPMPRGTPRHMPAQKALAPRNAPPPHAGAKGPCPAKLPAAACRQSDIRQRGKRFRPLRSPLPTKITIYRVKKGRRRIFSPRRPKPGQHRSPKTRPKARTETPSEGSSRSPVAGAESARLPTRSTAPEELSKRAILPTDAIGKKRRDFHRPKASTTGLLTKYARKKTV